MIRAFWQSKLAAAGVFVLSLAVAAAIWVRDADRPLYIPILAAVLMLSIGAAAGLLVGNLVADARNVKLLGLLHMDLDPEKFLAQYTQVPDRFPKGSVHHVVTCSYLADGYAAAGEFDKAIAALCPPDQCKGGGSPALWGTYWQKLCSYQISKGDLAQAKKALEGLDGVIETPGARPELLKNLKESRRLLHDRMACRSNRQAERDWLERQPEKAPYKLLRLEIWQALAQLALREGRERDAAGYLDLLQKEGGSTFYPRWALEQRKALGGQ